MNEIIPQQKMLPGGQLKRWELDIAAMASCAEWARDDPSLLADEIAQIAKAFPTMIAVAGTPLGSQRCWVEAAEPMLCERDDELVVFERGTRCVQAGHPVAVPQPAMVGVVVRIPALISGRPFERALVDRIQQLHRSNPTTAELWEASLIVVDGKRYLAPRFGLWFSQLWPHSDPPVMVWSEYFAMLDIPPDHVYYADQYYRLCLYASWREQPACHVLQNRVVPRLLIDLLVADLQAVGRLDDALERLDASLYELYNVVGRPREVEPLRGVYRELVGADVQVGIS